MTDDDKRRSRPERPAGRSPRDAPLGRGQRQDQGERPIWQQRVEMQRDPNREKSPLIPESITPNDVDMWFGFSSRPLLPKTLKWLPGTWQWSLY